MRRLVHAAAGGMEGGPVSLRWRCSDSRRQPFLRSRMAAPTAAGPFLQAHLKSLQDFPPRQGADTLSLKKAIDGAMQKMANPVGSAN